MSHKQLDMGLTNARSKRKAQHAVVQNLFFAFYNCCRKHEALEGQPPATGAEIADGAWTIKDLLEQAAQ